MDQDTQDASAVQLVAVDSFHSSQTGSVAARAKFETHRAHADELIKRGLAAEVEARRAAPPSNKMAKSAQNKSASAGEAK